MSEEIRAETEPMPESAAAWGGSWAKNGKAVPIADVRPVPLGAFRQACLSACATTGRLSALFVVPRGAPAPGELWAVLSHDSRGRLALVRAELPADRRYPALSAELPQAQAFEREIFEEHGVEPVGHPWLKPLRRHAELSLGSGPRHDFFRVEGAGIHEVAVGPVHAGIIEPGHFRFQCRGERVLSLEIQLGYQHRGAEQLLASARPERRLAIAESIAGDTSVGHALSCCAALEGLAKREPPLHAQALRGIALELERLANHVGDLGALANDVGYLPGASWFGRLRGDFLNLLLELSGNRFGRGLLVPGGVRFFPSAGERKDFVARLDRARRDLEDTGDALFGSGTVGARFEQTGVIARKAADELGLVGPAARASGCDRDVRRDLPHGIYRFAHVPVSRQDSGDVMARALVRWHEALHSLTFVRDQLAELTEAKEARALGPLAADHVVVSLTEGWRGEIVHVALTGAEGELRRYKLVDPSFHNWLGLASAMRDNEISDFPLCNKSFNLSYAGHDL